MNFCDLEQISQFQSTISWPSGCNDGTVAWVREMVSLFVPFLKIKILDPAYFVIWIFFCNFSLIAAFGLHFLKVYVGTAIYTVQQQKLGT